MQRVSSFLGQCNDYCCVYAVGCVVVYAILTDWVHISGNKMTFYARARITTTTTITNKLKISVCHSTLFSCIAMRLKEKVPSSISFIRMCTIICIITATIRVVRCKNYNWYIKLHLHCEWSKSTKITWRCWNFQCSIRMCSLLLAFYHYYCCYYYYCDYGTLYK